MGILSRLMKSTTLQEGSWRAAPPSEQHFPEGPDAVGLKDHIYYGFGGGIP